VTATLSVRVARKAAETFEISTIDLVAADGSSLPPFTAGAHIDVHLPNGMVRQYSLCNDPADAGRYQLGVLKDMASRGGSRAVHEQLAVGDTLTISTPRNLFPLAPSAVQHHAAAGHGRNAAP